MTDYLVPILKTMGVSLVGYFLYKGIKNRKETLIELESSLKELREHIKTVILTLHEEEKEDTLDMEMVDDDSKKND